MAALLPVALLAQLGLRQLRRLEDLLHQLRSDLGAQLPQAALRDLGEPVGRGLPVALHPLQDVSGISAFEGLDDAVVDLPGDGAHLVEEPGQRRGEARPGTQVDAILEGTCQRGR